MDDTTSISDENICWCVHKKWHVYRDTNIYNEKGMMIRLVTMERRVLTGSLPTFPEVYKLLNLHKFY